MGQDLLGYIVFCSSNALAQIRDRSWVFISIELDCQERSRDAKPPGVGKGAVRCSALCLYLAVRFVFLPDKVEFRDIERQRDVVQLVGS